MVCNASYTSRTGLFDDLKMVDRVSPARLNDIEGLTYLSTVWPSRADIIGPLAGYKVIGTLSKIQVLSV